MTNKTLAMRILDGHGIPYEVHHYSTTETDAGLVATAIGASPNEVFKTLVVQRMAGKPMLVMIPANKKLDLKKLAKTIDEKKVKMASHEEAERITGLQAGGISAIALLNRGFDIFVDAEAMKHNKIYISAGNRGIQIRLGLEDMLSITSAKVITVSR
jgi:Cys-tRNA(Pro)/Cys-tRNA(Cys) deacylase